MKSESKEEEGRGPNKKPDRKIELFLEKRFFKCIHVHTHTHKDSRRWYIVGNLITKPIQVSLGNQSMKIAQGFDFVSATGFNRRPFVITEVTYSKTKKRVRICVLICSYAFPMHVISL